MVKGMAEWRAMVTPNHAEKREHTFADRDASTNVRLEGKKRR
jgi:hypothetical protein